MFGYTDMNAEEGQFDIVFLQQEEALRVKEEGGQKEVVSQVAQKVLEQDVKNRLQVQENREQQAPVDLFVQMLEKGIEKQGIQRKDSFEVVEQEIPQTVYQHEVALKVEEDPFVQQLLQEEFVPFADNLARFQKSLEGLNKERIKLYEELGEIRREYEEAEKNYKSLLEELGKLKRGGQFSQAVKALESQKIEAEKKSLDYESRVKEFQQKIDHFEESSKSQIKEKMGLIEGEMSKLVEKTISLKASDFSRLPLSECTKALEKQLKALNLEERFKALTEKLTEFKVNRLLQKEALKDQEIEKFLAEEKRSNEMITEVLGNMIVNVFVEKVAMGLYGKKNSVEMKGIFRTIDQTFEDVQEYYFREGLSHRKLFFLMSSQSVIKRTIMEINEKKEGGVKKVEIEGFGRGRFPDERDPLIPQKNELQLVRTKDGLAISRVAFLKVLIDGEIGFLLRLQDFEINSIIMREEEDLVENNWLGERRKKVSLSLRRDVQGEKPWPVLLDLNDFNVDLTKLSFKYGAFAQDRKLQYQPVKEREVFQILRVNYNNIHSTDMNRNF